MLGLLVAPLDVGVARRVGGHRRVGRLVEAEAYIGPRDLASPSARGRTPRHAALSGPPGHAGIELIDGAHHCPDAVTGPEGYAAAVLTRALEPVRPSRGRRPSHRGPCPPVIARETEEAIGAVLRRESVATR
jgi:3-methyladenine DNA glycosylase Mpg